MDETNVFESRVPILSTKLSLKLRAFCTELRYLGFIYRLRETIGIACCVEFRFGPTVGLRAQFENFFLYEGVCLKLNVG